MKANVLHCSEPLMVQNTKTKTMSKLANNTDRPSQDSPIYDFGFSTTSQRILSVLKGSMTAHFTKVIVTTGALPTNEFGS